MTAVSELPTDRPGSSQLNSSQPDSVHPVPAHLDGQQVRVDEVVARRSPWSKVVRAGELLTIVDLEGNQAVDFLLYDAADTDVRYSAPDTIAAQRNIYLTNGSVLRANTGEAMMTLVHDEVGRHDTIGGACSKESNSLRYGHHTVHQHACVENFLAEGALWGLGKRDLVSNINFYMNVPVEADGALGIVDGLSAPGRALTLRADRDVLVLVSNCPQINNPCNGFNPTPVRMIVTSPESTSPESTTPASTTPASTTLPESAAA